MKIEENPVSFVNMISQCVDELEELEEKENKTDTDELEEKMNAISLKQTNIFNELKEMKEQLSAIPKHLVKNFVDKTIQASELNKLVYNFYDAFRESPKDDPVRFECMEILAYMGIIIYKEQDFIPYTDESTDDVEDYECYL